VSDYRLHVLLAPHLGNQGGGNTAWVSGVDGRPCALRAARRQRISPALFIALGLKLSVGYVGSSDGWQDLKAHKRMTWEYTRAENGNVALIGEVDLLKTRGAFVLALGFGKDADEAARNAGDSLHDGFETAKHDYVEGWRRWTKTRILPEKNKSLPGIYRKRAWRCFAPMNLNWRPVR
jgi:glucoamylase